ncbi:MAG: hypothetical protein ACREL6_12840 [Gemmatimonadales bacterium]
MIARKTVLFIGIPLAVLALAHLWLALEHGSLWLWDLPVHESGRYTFGETVLYFAHFLREIPVDVAIAFFLLAAIPEVPAAEENAHRLAGLARNALGAAIGLILVAGVVVAVTDGVASGMRDLLQFRTRDDMASFGSHWHFHWLSTLWIGVAAPVVVRGVPTSHGTADSPPHQLAVWVAWGYFVALTLIFGLSGESFADPRYIGHQAREIFTHAPVTMLLTIGILRLAGGRPSHAAASRWMPESTGRRLAGLAQLLLTLAIPLYLGWGIITRDVMAAGQSEGGMAAMIGAHFFEHTFDYLLVVLLALGLSPWLSARAGGSG